MSRDARSWPAAVILAGGRSSRMGSEKALLDAGGETMLELLAAKLSPRFDQLILSSASGGPSKGLRAAIERASAAAGREIQVVEDSLADQGPLAGVEAALEELDGSLAFFIAVDNPSISFELVAALCDAVETSLATGCVPKWSHGLEPAHAVYSKCLLADVRRLLASGERSLQALAAAPRVKVIDLESPAARRSIFGSAPLDLGELFRSLNRPEDHEAWLRGRK